MCGLLSLSTHQPQPPSPCCWLYSLFSPSSTSPGRRASSSALAIPSFLSARAVSTFGRKRETVCSVHSYSKCSR